MFCLICLKSIFVSICRKNIKTPQKITRFTLHYPTKKKSKGKILFRKSYMKNIFELPFTKFVTNATSPCGLWTEMTSKGGQHHRQTITQEECGSNEDHLQN